MNDTEKILQHLGKAVAEADPDYLAHRVESKLGLIRHALNYEISGELTEDIVIGLGDLLDEVRGDIKTLLRFAHEVNECVPSSCKQL